MDEPMSSIPHEDFTARYTTVDNHPHQVDNDLEDKAEHGRIDGIDGADDCEDNTDKDVETFTDDETRVLSSTSTEPLCDEMAKTSGDTVTSVTDEFISSLSSPSSDLDALSSELLDVSPMKLSGDEGLLSESDLQHLAEELKLVGKIHSTPVAPRMPGNLTFVADVATPDSDTAGSIHDFNVQTMEKLESCTAKSVVLEQAEREEEELSMTDPSTSLSLATELQIANSQNGHTDANNTFTLTENGSFIRSNAAVNGNSKQKLNTTFTMPASAPPGEPSQSLVRSETHSSGYQSDVMVNSTTSSDAMATSVTSGDVMISSAGSNDADNNNEETGHGKRDSNLNRYSNGSTTNETKSRLSKPRYSGLQKPKFSSATSSEKINKVEIVSDEGQQKRPVKEKRQLVAPSAGRGKPSGLTKHTSLSNTVKPNTGTTYTTTGPKASSAPSGELKSKLPSALPKPGRTPSYGGGTAKTNSKLPSYGGGSAKATPAEGKRLKAPSKSSSRH